MPSLEVLFSCKYAFISLAKAAMGQHSSLSGIYRWLYSGMGNLRIFQHLQIFLGSQCMTFNGNISIKRGLHAILA